MQIQFFTNACVAIKSDSGSTVICDPWVNEGAFLGSWFHWPPVPENFEELILNYMCDAIYISHLHPDHYDPNFIAKFTKMRPEVPILIADFSHEWLKRSIQSVKNNATELIIVNKNERIVIGKDLEIEIFAADECNPIICGTNTTCQTGKQLRGIDSIAIFAADGQRVVNANDAMGIHLIPKIAANIGKADLLMGHFGGASAFPQCFPLIEDKKAAGKAVVEKTCNMLLAAGEAISAEYIMPFAGQYVLGGSLSSLNSDRAVLPIDEVKEFLSENTCAEIITLNPEGIFNLSTGYKDDDYTEPDKKIYNEYIEKISKVTFPYHNRSQTKINLETLLKAAAPVIEMSLQLGWNLENSFIINDGTNFLTINLGSDEQDTFASLGENPLFPTVTKITMHQDLLSGLISKRPDYKGFTPMHWNQADVGSHFIWERTGDFNLNAHMLLNYFGT